MAALSPMALKLPSLDPAYECWLDTSTHVLLRRPSLDNLHTEHYVFLRQKIWPCNDGVYEPLTVIEDTPSRIHMQLVFHKYVDLTDPFAQAVFAAIKGGASPGTAQLVADLLPTCSDWKPGDDY